jgi:hypothetical protein
MAGVEASRSNFQDSDLLVRLPSQTVHHASAVLLSKTAPPSIGFRISSYLRKRAHCATEVLLQSLPGRLPLWQGEAERKDHPHLAADGFPHPPGWRNLVNGSPFLVFLREWRSSWHGCHRIRICFNDSVVANIRLARPGDCSRGQSWLPASNAEEFITHPTGIRNGDRGRGAVECESRRRVAWHALPQGYRCLSSMKPPPTWIRSRMPSCRNHSAG